MKIICRGTSSLQFSDSDLEQGGPAGAEPQGKPGRSRHARYCHNPDNPLKLSFIRLHEYRTKREGAGAELPGVESDSFNENISPFKVQHHQGPWTCLQMYSRSSEPTVREKESSKEWQWMKAQKIGNPGWLRHQGARRRKWGAGIICSEICVFVVEGWTVKMPSIDLDTTSLDEKGTQWRLGRGKGAPGRKVLNLGR